MFTKSLENLLYKFFLKPLTISIVNKFLIKKISGLDNLSKNSPVILAANHSSYLDFLIIPSIIKNRKIYIIAAEELKSTKFFGIYARNDNRIFLNRNKPSHSFFKKAFKTLKHSNCLLIFPEGTRSIDGNVKNFKPTFVKLASISGAPIIPVAIYGTFKLLPKIGSPNLKQKCSVYFYKPISIPPNLSKLDAQNYADQIKSRIETLLKNEQQN